VGAGRVEPALPAEDSSQQNPVGADEAAQGGPGGPAGRPQETADRRARFPGAAPPRETCLGAHRDINPERSSRACSSCSRSLDLAWRIPLLATNTTSAPRSIRGASDRQASRRTRRARLRWTAPPTPRPATNAAASPSGLGRTYSITRLPACRRPACSASRIPPPRRVWEPAPEATIEDRRGVQADSRVRPLDRRRARMARPARLRIRTRKPCRFLRRRVLGWKVFFKGSRLGAARCGRPV